MLLWIYSLFFHQILCLRKLFKTFFIVLLVEIANSLFFMFFYFFDIEHSITQKLFFLSGTFSHLKTFTVFFTLITFIFWFFWLKVEDKLHHFFLIVKPATSIHVNTFVVTLSHLNTTLSFQIYRTLFRVTIKSVEWQLA